jgi:hypothetical protein
MSDMQRTMERHQADERIRLTQQGRGRPILSWQVGDHRLVAVGNAVHFSRAWKTFPDFLAAYVKRILDPEWGNAELAKPFDERHPIIQWYHAFCLYQHETRNVHFWRISGQIGNEMTTFFIRHGLATNAA